MSLPHTILESLRSVIGTGPAQLHAPWFTGKELAYVQDCIETGWVSSVGGYVDRFEADLAAYTGAAKAIVVSNGTSGLQVALELVGVQRGDEVIVPALSFVATANAVAHAGAIPHFADSTEATLGLDVAALAEHLQTRTERRAGACFNRETGRRIAAVVPMHTFGHPVDMPALQELAADHHLEIVEDAAESLGSRIHGRHTGTFGRCGVLSFNGNKIITTGGGGAIVTDDLDLARRAKHITTTSKRPHRWEFDHDEVAYNFRMPNVNAALGCAQLEQLDGFLARKRELTNRYANAFADVRGVRLFTERAGTHANYWLQTLLLDDTFAHQRDEVLAVTNDAGVMTRPVWKLLPTLPMYGACPSMPLPVATNLAARIVNVPSGPQLLA